MASKDFEEFIRKETLIGLVEKRPVVWDKSQDIYKDKTAKAAAWREICAILMKDFENLEQKERQEFVKLVIKKWSQTRDSWIRTLHDKKKANKSGAPVKPYRYHKQMLFLKKVIHADTHESVSTKKFNYFEDSSRMSEEINRINEEDSESQEEDSQNRHILAQRTPKRSAVKRKSTDVDERMISYMDHQLKMKAIDHEDRNLSFFKSLLPSLALLDDDQTLEFQSGVLNLLRNIKRSRVGQSTYDWSSPQTSSNNNYAHGYQTQVHYKRQHIDSAQSSSQSSEASIKSEPVESVQ